MSWGKRGVGGKVWWRGRRWVKGWSQVGRMVPLNQFCGDQEGEVQGLGEGSSLGRRQWQESSGL